MNSDSFNNGGIPPLIKRKNTGKVDKRKGKVKVVPIYIIPLNKDPILI